MLRERFKIGMLMSAIAAMFHTRQLQKEIPAVTPHDDFHHDRNKHQLSGRAFIRKHRRHRNARNEMAFQSRKRNRT